MKTILTSLIVALCLVTHAQHSFELNYTSGMNNHYFEATYGPVASMLVSGGVGYKFISKKGIGLSFGVDASGYSVHPQKLNTAKFSSYRDLHNRYMYLSTPLMVEVRGGKKKTKFIMHAGITITYAMYYRLQYSYFESTPPSGPIPSQETRQYIDKRYADLKPMQFGVPMGIGVHIDLSPKYYLEISAEDRLLFGKITTNEGLVNTLGIRLALGINATKKAKEPKQ